MSLVYSNGKPDVTNRSYPIGVRFAQAREIEIPIKQTDADLVFQHRMSAMSLSLLEIAGVDDEKTVDFSTGRRRTPFIDLRLNLEKTDVKIDIKTNMTRTMPTKKKIENKKDSTKPLKSSKSVKGAPVVADSLSGFRRQTEFHLQAPKARSVKLAADFTNWEKSPMEMIRDEEGQWYASVSLSPGEYAYRFIVDGEWSDDPLAFQSLPNPYGSVNSVRRVS